MLAAQTDKGRNGEDAMGKLIQAIRQKRCQPQICEMRELVS